MGKGVLLDLLPFTKGPNVGRYSCCYLDCQHPKSNPAHAGIFLLQNLWTLSRSSWVGGLTDSLGVVRLPSPHKIPCSGYSVFVFVYAIRVVPCGPAVFLWWGPFSRDLHVSSAVHGILGSIFFESKRLVY